MKSAEHMLADSLYRTGVSKVNVFLALYHSWEQPVNVPKKPWC